MLLDPLNAALSNFFMQPTWLLALLALIPLIVFYLIQREPEQQVMPAMMFFMKDKKSGKAQQAFRTLMRNLLLLFHILLIVGLAAAMAHPYMNAPSKPDQTVTIMDHSASMANDMSRAKEFVDSHLGKENTLITVGSDVKVPVEKGSAGKVQGLVDSTDARDIRTDIASAIELASDYKGTIIVASDLDQTTSQQSASKIVENLRNQGRKVEVLDIDEKNAWGIVNVEPGKDNSTVDVKNFLDQKARVTVTTDGSSREVLLKPKELRTITVSTSPGKNTVKLEKDGFERDNTAYISIPEQKKYKVVFIRDHPNPYFRKAVQLIEFTSIETVKPPVDRELNGDIYVLGDTDRVLSETVRKVEKDVHDGSSLVVFGRRGVFNLNLESITTTPIVKKDGGLVNSTVTLKKPVKTTFDTQMMDVNVTGGESLSSPEGAMVRGSYGDGNVLFYNIDDKDFHFNFIYPVFWKSVLKDLVDRPSLTDLNRPTGSTVTGKDVVTPSGKEKSGTVSMDESGFYTVDGKTYAANLENQDESFAEKQDIQFSDSSVGTEKRDVQKLAALLLAFLMLGEYGYLRRLGDA
ncbi:MAG: VWA domain-containing protein [Candidatus Nanohaloarchaea archaeon]